MWVFWVSERVAKNYLYNKWRNFVQNLIFADVDTEMNEGTTENCEPDRSDRPEQLWDHGPQGQAAPLDWLEADGECGNKTKIITN